MLLKWLSLVILNSIIRCTASELRVSILKSWLGNIGNNIFSDWSKILEAVLHFDERDFIYSVRYKLYFDKPLIEASPVATYFFAITCKAQTHFFQISRITRSRDAEAGTTCFSDHQSNVTIRFV